MLDCVWESIFPARAATQFTQAQFHCGRPPPAALPRMWIRINPTYVVIPARSDRAGVTGAFKKDRHCFERRFDPPFFRSHESLRSIRSYATWVNLFFDEADVAAAFYARESNIGKVVRVYAKPHVFFQSCVETWLRHIMPTSHCPSRTMISGLPLTKIPNLCE